MKNKLFVCLRPMVMEPEDSKQKLLDREQNREISTIKSSLSDIERVKILGPDPRKTASRLTLRRALKAILFEASLRKTVRDRQVYDQLTLPSNTDTSLHISSDKSVNPTLLENNSQQNISSSVVSSSLSYSSSCSSSSSECKTLGPLSTKKSLSQSRSDSFSQKRESLKIKNETISGCSSSNSGLFWIVIALFVTIFWGRVFAILFTSAWLYFLPDRSIFLHPTEYELKLPERVASRDNKKRVIMEGLLERNHHLQRALNF